MRARKYWLSVVIVVAICATALGETVEEQGKKKQIEDTKLLQAKIENLEQTVETQQDIIKRSEEVISKLKQKLAEQIQENKRLQALCKEAGINTAKPGKTSFSPGEVIYREKKRSQRWFDRIYERFRYEIAYVDGEYIDKNLVQLEPISGNKPWPNGSIAKAPSGCKVLQVLGPGEALIWKEAFKSTHSGSTSGIKGVWAKIATAALSTREILFHLTAYEGQLVDEQYFSFEGPLICMGTFEYTNTVGAKKTIQSFAVCKSFYEPLTREQFAEAIKSGFELVYYKKVGGRIIRRPIR